MSKFENVRRELTKYDYIRFAVCDINGHSRGQVVTARNAAKYFENGLDVYEGILLNALPRRPDRFDSDQCTRSGNISLVPDVTTIRHIPWCDVPSVKIAEVLCEPCWKTDGSPQKACPRYVLRQQLKRLEDLGLEVYSGFEIEYNAFHSESMTPINSGVFMCHRNQNKNGRFLINFDQQMLQSGVEIDKFHTEDNTGMFEMVMKPTYGIESADATFNCKQGLLEFGDLNGTSVSYMTLRMPNDIYVGTGCHFNFSLLSAETGQNVFYDKTKRDNLSHMAKLWIAGLLKHSKALTALNSPTVNCYRRLHQQWTPGSIFWGIDDRDACFRVKNNGNSGTYIENRIPSGKSNPYIVMASTIAAGLDGVLNQLVCPPSGKRTNAESLPESLEESLQELDKDKDFVNALGKEFVAWFTAVKGIDLRKFGKVMDDNTRMIMEREMYF